MIGKFKIYKINIFKNLNNYQIKIVILI
jgi:hypothetical protein